MDTNLPSVFSISPQDLRARIGAADGPLLLDVRRAARFVQGPRILAGAQRCTPEDLAALAASPAQGEVVVYCAYGHELSQDAAKQLRAAGWPAHFLAGGIDGGEEGVDAPQDIARWRQAACPAILKRPDLGVTGEMASRWITRERPKIDRVACPWLVRRFIDRQAAFFYVPAAQVLSEAKRRDAVAYDIVGGAITHEGEQCSFDALLRAFALDDPALLLLATIVRGADTDRLDLAPESAGLLALSLGLSALHADDDWAMLVAAMPLYDALYARCRMQVAGLQESHNWTPGVAK